MPCRPIRITPGDRIRRSGRYAPKAGRRCCLRAWRSVSSAAPGTARSFWTCHPPVCLDVSLGVYGKLIPEAAMSTHQTPAEISAAMQTVADYIVHAGEKSLPDE